MPLFFCCLGMSNFFAAPWTVCSPPGSSVHGIVQARILDWVSISFSRGSSKPGSGIHVSCLAGGFFATELPGKPLPLFTHLQNEDIQVDPLDPSRAQSLQVKVFY